MVRHKRKKRRRGVLLGALLAAVFVAAVACYAVGSALSAPRLHLVGPPPSDLNAVAVEFSGLSGWFVRAKAGAPCILLMHGIRADRRSMIERARLLRQAGYSSLLFDFQAHGESPGQYITFGYLESANARAAVALLHTTFQCPKIAAIGQSLGGVAALLGEGPLQVDALVLESVYPTFEEAVADRLRLQLGRAAVMLGPLLTMQLKPRLGIDVQVLRPIDHIASFRQPLLVLSGTEDQHTRLEEARRLFEAANEPKEFWAVEGAAHEDLYKFVPEAYGQRVLGFLGKYLKAPNPRLQSDRDPRAVLSECETRQLGCDG